MKTKIILFFSSLLQLLLSSGCTADIDLKTNDSDPVIVIYGILTDEYKKQTVRITRSSPYFSEDTNTVVSHADVRITSSRNEVFELTESKEQAGVYETTDSLSAQVGVSYRLSVEVDFDGDGTIDHYQAETIMQPAIQVDSIQLKAMNIMGEPYYALNLYAYDSSEKDYYLCRYLVNDTLQSDRISRFNVIDDEVINGSYVDGLTIQYFPDQSKKEDYKDDDSFKQMIFITTNDRVTLLMSKIEKGYYQFILDCQREMKGENPFFGGPASNIRTNISNGGTGYFTAYAVAYGEALTPNPIK